MYEKTGLVLEGGGMRGSYTAGVLDYFTEKSLEFSSVYGVSAGALMGASFVCGQKERGFRTLTGYIGNKDYSGLHHYIKTGDFYNIDFAYNKIPNELDPADYDAFSSSPMNFYSVISNIKTGKAEYYHITDLKKEMDRLRASASLPLLSNPVVLNGQKYLDGGISDSIPLERSIHDGNEKHVVILTQHRGFVKKPSSNKHLTRFFYRKYPNFIGEMENRHNMYNAQTKFVYEKEKEGSVFVIQPEKPVEIARLEKDKTKLKRLYDTGYRQAEKMYTSLIKFLER